MQRKTGIYVIGYLLVLCYGLMLVWLSRNGSIPAFELSLLLLMIVGLLGFIKAYIWAPRVIVFVGGGGIAYILTRWLVLIGQMDLIPEIVFILMSLTVMAFYNLPVLSRQAFGLGIYPWTILIIDDDRALLKLLESNFRRYGIFVLTADTGEKGLFMADRHKPDLIILDVILPKMKGREVCARLKEAPQTSEIPVIFLTAKNSMDDIQAEIAAGAHVHITKPVDFKDLFSQVKKILST